MKSTLNPHDFSAWVFDLDNTLYPSECNLFAQIDVRMGRFIAETLEIDPDEAKKLQKEYYFEFGTTLAGLMKRHNVTPDAFLDYVHQIDVTAIPPNQKLNEALSHLPGRKIIFTNGSSDHAQRVTEQLGIDHHFDTVVDIARMDYAPKPDSQSFAKLLEISEIDPRNALMMDDIEKNLLGAHQIGMTTVWVPTRDYRAENSPEITDFPHIDHLTENLTEFLAEAVDAHQIG